MEILTLLVLFIIGLIAGLIGGMLGLSGGVLTVPCLIVYFSLNDFPHDYVAHLAIGTSLAAMVLNAIASTWAHEKAKGVKWSIVLYMLPGVIIGSLLGPLIANFLSGRFLEVLFGLFLCLVGAYILLKKRSPHPDGEPRPPKALFTWIGLGVGTLASLLGIGGGAFTVPLLLLFHYREKEAVGTSAAVGLCITILAALGYLFFGMGKIQHDYTVGYLYLPAFALVGIGAVLFAPLGAKIAHKIHGSMLRRIFAGALILIGILMLF